MPSTLRLYNTLTKKKEFPKGAKKTIRFYACGPTVYGRAHIGNLRTYVFTDTLQRAFRMYGHDIEWVMNITDVDDKTVRQTVEKFGGAATVKDLKDYTTEHFERFKEDLKALNVDVGRIRFVRVSDEIPAIIAFIKKLLRKKFAYKAPDGVYFDIARYQKHFRDYGALVGKNFLKGKKIGARVKVDEYDKKNLSDFALWKAPLAEDGNIFWNDPELGPGRPGWHIECSAINDAAFGHKPTDIHAGAVDLIFPHHTNEIAQSQPVRTPFVRLWAHGEHVLVDGKKMSKSLGNVYTLDDLARRGISPLAFRYLALTSHYRSKMNFTWKGLAAADTALRNVYAHTASIRSAEMQDMSKIRPAKIAAYGKKLRTAMGEDLNTAKALALLQQALKATDLHLVEKRELLFNGPFEEALGLQFLSHIRRDDIPPSVRDIAEERDRLRRNKQFMQADRLRDELDRLGYTVSDTPDGPVVQPKQ